MRAIVVLLISFGAISAVTSIEQHNEDHNLKEKEAHYRLKEKSHHNLKENVHHLNEKAHHRVNEKTHHHVNEKTHHHPNEKSHGHNINEKVHHHANEKVHHHANEKVHHANEKVHHHHLKEKSHHHLKEKSHNSHGEYNHYSGHHLKQEVKHHQGSHFFHHGYRVREDTHEDAHKNCRWVCDGEPPTNNPNISLDYKILYNSSSSLFALANVKLQLALVINYQSNSIILINGKTGVTYILSGSSQEVIRLKQSPETKDVLWDPSATSFTAYYGKLSTDNLLKIGQQYGQKFDLSKLSETESKEIEEIFKNLGFAAPILEEVRFISTFASHLKTIFGLFYKGSGSFYIQNDFHWFVKLNVFLANLLDPSTSGIDLSKINIDPKNIFSGASGIEAFIKLFTQIGRNTDLSKLATSLFSSRERVLKFFSEISGGSHNGLDGLISISVNVAKALSGQGSINDVITSISKYNSTDLNEPTYSQIIDQGLELVRSQQNLYHSHAFDGLYTFLKALADNNLILNSVNISDIIKIFFSPNPLDRASTVIKVLSTFAPQRGIPQFFKFITQALNSSNPSHFLSDLIPGFNFSQFGNGNALQNILQGRNLTQLLSGGGNASEIWSQIPFFGRFAEPFAKFINPQHIQAFFTGNWGNLTSGGNIFGGGLQNGIQGLFNASQGGGGAGGIASGIQNGLQGLINASQSGGGSGGIAGSIQNGIGNLFGISAQGSTQLSSGSEATTSKPEESSGSTIAASTDHEKSSEAGAEETTSPVFKGTIESESAASSTASEVTGAETSESEKTSEASASHSSEAQSSSSGAFSLRGSVTGGFTEELRSHNRHRAQNKRHQIHNHNQKSEEKLHGKQLH